MVSHCRDWGSRRTSGFLSNGSSDVDTAVGIVLKLCHVWNARIVSLMLIPVVNSAIFTIRSVLCVDANIFKIQLVGSIVGHRRCLTGPFILHVETRTKALVWYRPILAWIWPLLWGTAASQLHVFTRGIQNLFCIILVWLSNTFIDYSHIGVDDALIPWVGALWWWTLDVLCNPRFNIVRWLSKLGN